MVPTGRGQVTIYHLHPAIRFAMYSVSHRGSFPFVPPQYVMLPPVTEHVSLHSKSLCKNIARLGVANNMHPVSWGGTNGKDPTSPPQEYVNSNQK